MYRRKVKAHFCKNERDNDFRSTSYTLIVALFFLFTMVFNLVHSAPWGDEWVEYHYSQAGIFNGDLYRNIVSTFQPPLYNVLMHFWLKVSTSIIWFRSFNVFVGLVSGYFCYKTVSGLVNEFAARITLCGLAICYQWVYSIQECSEYSLMMMFAFIAIERFIYLRKSYTNRKLVCFILASVCAIYSQYGAVFVILPLLFVFYIGNFVNSTSSHKEKKIITFSYVGCFVLFALPLYHFFLRQQLYNHEIGRHLVRLGFEEIRELFFTFISIFCYFYKIKIAGLSILIVGIIAILFIIWSFFYIHKINTYSIKKELIITFWICYVFHYFMVVFHIYAMLHSDVSLGFFSRYSLFYIPLFSVVIPIFCEDIIRNHSVIIQFKWTQIISIVFLIIIFFRSIYLTSINWYKAKDDQYAKIWYLNEGWKDTTYLIGQAGYGFRYYVMNNKRYKDGYLSKVSQTIDLENLPASFWLWRTNWDGALWEQAVQKAKKTGYKVFVYDDSGEVGQLAFCYKKE